MAWYYSAEASGVGRWWFRYRGLRFSLPWLSFWSLAFGPTTMKSRQLANVLFKVLGFSVCLYAIPSCVSGILIGIQAHISSSGSEVARVVSYAIGAGVQLAIGIAIIAMSQKISDWLFKSDDE